ACAGRSHSWLGTAHSTGCNPLDMPQEKERAHVTTTAYPQHRPTTLATHGIVAAPHYLAAQAGLDLLKAGGNAVDAAVAANAVLQVVYPLVCGLGGDLFALLYDARTQTLHGLNSSGRAPQAATLERYAELGYAAMPAFGLHTITVPGCAMGWGMLAERFGRLGLDRSL